MAMVRCPECGQSVSDREGKCSYCGCPIRTTTSNQTSNQDTKGVINISDRIDLDDPNDNHDENRVVIQDNKANVLLVVLGVIAAIVIVVTNVLQSNHNKEQERVEKAIKYAQQVMGGSSFNVHAYKIEGKTEYPTYQVTGDCYIINNKWSWSVKIILKEDPYFSYYDQQLYPKD